METGDQREIPSSTLEVAIIGGGIAGLTAAIALKSHPRVKVTIYERAKQFREIGASIGLGPNGVRSLEKLGVEDALTIDICSRQQSNWPMIYRHWATGEIIAHDVHHTVKTKKHFTSRYHRAHLHEVLRGYVPQEAIHFHKKIINIEASPKEPVRLFFEDGSSATADICLGADGIHSNTRKIFVPNHSLYWTGWVAFRAAFDAKLVEHIDFPQDAAHWVGHNRTFFHSHLGRGQFTTVGSYHTDPNDPRAQYRDAKWSSDGDLNVLKEYYKDWHPTIKALIEATPYIKLYPNVAGSVLEHYTFFNRVGLLGDAAHTHGGAFAAGGSLAIDDAYCFSLALFHVFPPTATMKPTSEELEKIFQLYERTRKPHIDKVLAKVHEMLEDQGKNVERAKNETEEQLKERIQSRFDPWWISEHDVEAAFLRTVQSCESQGKDVLSSRL